MPILSPLQKSKAPHYGKGSSTNVGKLIVAKKSHHGWLHIDDVIIVAKNDFAPPKFSLVAALVDVMQLSKELCLTWTKLYCYKWVVVITYGVDVAVVI